MGSRVRSSSESDGGSFCVSRRPDLVCTPPSAVSPLLTPTRRYAGPDGDRRRWLVQPEACLFELGARQLLGYRLSADGRTLFTALPLVTDTVFNPASPVPSGRVVLPRSLHASPDSPRARDPMTPAWSSEIPRDRPVRGIAAPTLVAEVGALADVPAGLVREAAAVLWASGMLVAVNAAGVAAEDGDIAVRHWEFHDLLFHARSRRGRHVHPYGATFRFKGEVEPAPVVPPERGVDLIDLPRSDSATLERDDPPFTQVLEARVSRRAFDARRPISLRELGEFLYRSARIPPARGRRLLSGQQPRLSRWRSGL